MRAIISRLIRTHKAIESTETPNFTIDILQKGTIHKGAIHKKAYQTQSFDRLF
ncbi:hypothetical protein GCM10008986_12650 [Salinibacillus aidingensis]|uniref:Uncharacterized protein n=1 Tax=Salinibacillus aidingensis TaxID=237684 RepID=A0ABN1B1L5_9BACI